MLPSAAHLSSGSEPLPLQAWSFPEGLEPSRDAGPARWIEESPPTFPWATVGSLLPEGFASYARILHPAHRPDEHGGQRIVSWAEVAEEHRRVLHPLAQFGRIAGVGDDPNEQPKGMMRPHEGDPPDEVLLPLIDVLAGFTESRDRCWFCVWDGFGGMNFLAGVENLPRVRMPGRDYILVSGPLESARIFSESRHAEGPQIWWPDDRGWCVATDIDLDSTYVGGSASCIERILADPRLESFLAQLSDRVDYGADEVNAP